MTSVMPARSVPCVCARFLMFVVISEKAGDS